MARVIVIGGGIGGLASAALLAHNGHDVTLEGILALDKAVRTYIKEHYPDGENQ